MDEMCELIRINQKKLLIHGVILLRKGLNIKLIKVTQRLPIISFQQYKQKPFC